jgi:type IV pilus assembly protein PilO
MNSMSSNKNTQLLLVLALVLALLFVGYYYVVKPKQDATTSMRNELNYLTNEIVALEEHRTSLQVQQSQTFVNEFTLRKKVPENRAIDSLILNMEEIEYATGSRILGIEFNNYDELVSGSGLQDPATHTKMGELQTTTATDGTETVETMESIESTEEAGIEAGILPVSTIATDALPPSLKLLTFNVEVISPNDDSLLNFIKEIEKIERIMHIDTIDYELPGEDSQFEEEPTDIVTANVQVTTFYYE